MPELLEVERHDEIEVLPPQAALAVALVGERQLLFFQLLKAILGARHGVQLAHQPGARLDQIPAGLGGIETAGVGRQILDRQGSGVHQFLRSVQVRPGQLVQLLRRLGQLRKLRGRQLRFRCQLPQPRLQSFAFQAVAGVFQGRSRKRTGFHQRTGALQLGLRGLSRRAGRPQTSQRQDRN